MMKKSKLLTLLRTFSLAEWGRLKEYIETPLFNKSTVVKKFFKYLDKHKNCLELINKTCAFEAIYPAQDYDDAKLANIMSDLLSLAEQFLSVEHFLNDVMQQKRRALLVYSERKLQKHYQFLYNSSSKELKKAKVNSSLLMTEYQLNQVALQNFTNQKIRRFDPIIRQTYKSLNTYYYLQLLKSACTLLSWRGGVSGDFSITSISNKIIVELSKSFNDQIPIVKIYLLIYQLLDGSDREDDVLFKSLMNLIAQYQTNIDEEEMRGIYLLAINYCARNMRKGMDEYLALMLSLYEEGISTGVLFDNGYLSHWTYTNVVRLGLKDKRFDWTERFINKYKSNLPPEAFSDAFHLNLADLHFNKQEYNEVLGHLSKVKFSDPFYHIASKLILIKTFYELYEEESLLSSLASFTLFLKRNKGISSAYKKTCLNFCGLLNQLMRNNQKKRDQLLKDINTIQPLTERAWLKKVWDDQGK